MATPQELLVPNGQLFAVAGHIKVAGIWIPWDGSVTGGGDGTIVDGVDATIKATVIDLLNRNPLAVAIVDASGNQITSFGGSVTNDGSFATPARQDTGNTSLASIDSKTPSLGQQLAAASQPVVLTAAQLSTLTPPAAIAGFATEATLLTILTESDFDTKVGSLTESAPATDTASSGLNGRLQRIAQRITSLIALVPAALTSLGNFKVSVNELIGTAISVNSGNKDAGTLRVAIATDQPLFTTTLARPEKAVYGSTTTVISTAVDVAAGNFSVTTTEFDNTNDSIVPYARWAKAVGSFPDWAAAPVAGTTVDLYGLLKDVDGTSDDTDAPSGTAAGGARYFGSFVIAAADALQRRTIVIDLLGVEKVDFYFINRTAQNMNNDGGTSAIVKITPFSYGVVI